MRLIIWKFIIQTLSIIGLNRRVIIFKEYPTTIWGLDHMTMLNACAEAHAFATLMLWKGGNLEVLLPRTGTTSSTSPPLSNPQRISGPNKFRVRQTIANPHISNAAYNNESFFRCKA